MDKKFLTKLFNSLKEIYNVESVIEERKEYLCELLNKYGYLPYPHQKSLEEITDAEAIICLEEKLKINKTYDGEKFIFDKKNISAVSRANYKDSSWMKREGHDIKLINLAALGNGNKSKEAGQFIDWIKQLIILPSGNIEKKILSTTMYLLPFNPREFKCAYIPKSSEVSLALENATLKKEIGLNSNEQVKLFISLAQLSGHPVIYDVLPQTGRFSKIVLANTFVVRWFDIKKLIQDIEIEAEKIAKELNERFEFDEVNKVKTLLINEILGKEASDLECSKEIEIIFRKLVFQKQRELSNIMGTKEKQESIEKNVRKIIYDVLNKNIEEPISEEEIENHNELIHILIENGFWSAPGGAWCSSGMPIFYKLEFSSNTPVFKHYDKYGNDVTDMAILDCQAPFYFEYLDKNEPNTKVIDFWSNYLTSIREEYNFDGYRVDHVDHVVDDASQTNGFPISYRASKESLNHMNKTQKNKCKHFASLAEYMLWDGYLKEYHQDMSFDVLWGNDMISQFQKTVATIHEDNSALEAYNCEFNDKTKLSILKTYNNQDGEIEVINQYPGQLSHNGALFKLLKLKFVVGGKKASRAVIYVDGDESFTEKGVQFGINNEESIKRNTDYEFYRKFNAINRLALKLIEEDSKSYINYIESDTGLASWYLVSKKSNQGILIVANEKPPTECIIGENREMNYIKNNPIFDCNIKIPDDFNITSKFILEDKALEYIEIKNIDNFFNNTLQFDKIEPSEFYLYKIQK